MSHTIPSLQRLVKRLRREKRELLLELRRYVCPQGHARVGYDGQQCPRCRLIRDQRARAARRAKEEQ